AGFAVMIFIGCILSPPSLMDDVDSVQAQIARNMVQSGDWVTARLDGVAYLEKSPLVYWMMAVSYKVFGFHDWAARIPIAASVVLLCWIVCKFGEWAFGATAGMYAGICLATCVGLFLFTRILIPDCILTLAIAVALYSMLRLLEDDRPARWPMLFWASTAIAVLLKGLIGVIFPIGAGVLFLVATRRLTKWKTLKSFRPVPGLLLFLAIAAPWFVVATIRNPPLFDFTTHSESGSYHGFFWFYFINEHVLRFLNRRYPRDYNTVPHLYFWLFHLLWLFPWSVYLPAVFRLDYRSGDRAARVRLLSVCWIGFVLVFFSLSTSQEYYTMPCYPAFALLIGSALASKDRTLGISTRLAAAINMAALIAILAILYMVRHVPTPGDISVALTEHPEAYTLSLGHMEDLTTQAFAYLRLPLVVAGIAFAVGVIGTWRWMEKKTVLLVAVMMALFFHAARLAMVEFDPYLSSRPLAEALLRSPEGTLIVDNPYWEFSSVFFYSNSRGLLLNGRRNNLEYGSYAPGAPNVFLQDSDLAGIWKGQTRCYLLTEKPNLPRIRGLLGVPALHEIKESGGKYLFSNQ
ncbi:MAG TPA: glycosyltransferase family 39 protein, partial [Blastocatellia bacterium]|nr:glycosyltransferase family 39 protein [Blastocatellia bacterium]